MGIKFENNSNAVKNAIQESIIAALHEAASEITSSAADNSRVKTGQLKGSWSYRVDESAMQATIGSPLENAIWEEFGTGEYALEGNGRKGGWTYVDEKGNGHFTLGKTPNRTLQKAFEANKNTLEKALQHHELK